MMAVLVFFRFTQTVASGECISQTGCTLRTSSPLNLNSIYQYKTKQRWASSFLLMCRIIFLYRCVLILCIFSTAVTQQMGFLHFLFVLSAHVHIGWISSGTIFLLFFKCCFGSVWLVSICWINILYAQSEPRCLSDYFTFTFMHFVDTFIQSDIPKGNKAILHRYCDIIFHTQLDMLMFEKIY